MIPLWCHWFPNTQALMFVVDSNDRETIGEAKYELHRLLCEVELKDCPLLVYAHKQDLPNAMSAAEVTDKLGLHSVQNREWHVEATGTYLFIGAIKGMIWLTEHFKKYRAVLPFKAKYSFDFKKWQNQLKEEQKQEQILQKENQKQQQILRKKREQHFKAYKKVIKEKFTLLIRIVRMNNVGLPRSGKTSFRRRIMGEILNILAAIQRGEKEQSSTGVAEAGGQVFIRNTTSTDFGAISSKEWSILKDLAEEAGMLSQFFYQRVQDKTPTTPSKTPEKAATGFSASAATVASGATLPPSAPGANILPGVTTTPKQGGLKRSLLKPFSSLAKSLPSAQEKERKLVEMFGIIESAMEAEDWDKVKYLLEDLILLINTDTGGQAEFLDLHASLVQGPSLNLLFSRLVDDLDSQFEVYYTNQEGVSTEKEDSIITVEQVLFQSLSSIACYGGTFSDGLDTSSREASNMQSEVPTESKVLFVGTYRDEVDQETFEKKDELLQKKIRSTPFYEKGIIEFASEGQLMLPVDNMHGGQDEIVRIRKILEKIIEKSFKKIEIPASWLLLSLQIRSKSLRTMSLEDCEELAGKMKISPPELQHALWFLHHHVGVLLYYPEIESLKGTVICDMQVVFDSATNLIKNTFTFDNVGQSASTRFREKAQFTLRDVMEATVQYTDDLIPLVKLVELLQYLGILTPIPPSTSSGGGAQEPTYFMPCVLKSARASELKVPSSGPAPLLLRYSCGYVPVGLFPSLITNLVSQQQELGWEMVEEGLRKNRVQFLVGDDHDAVTLISHPRYFEIVISQHEGSLCIRVREVIESTLDIATSRTNYRFSMVYNFAFECPVHPGREHLCVLTKKSAKDMKCLYNPKKLQYYPLEPHHKVWFSDFHPGAHTESKPSVNTLAELKTIEKVSPQWRQLGLCLGQSMSVLDNYERKEMLDNITCCTRVFDQWIKNDGTSKYPLSWKGVYDALCAIEHCGTANDMKSSLASKYELSIL